MRYTDELLDSLRLRGDPEVDAFIPELMRGRRLEDVNRILAAYQVNGQPPPESLPPVLTEWLAGTMRLPAWADRAKLERASAMFVDHGLSISVMLGMVSLLECYAAAKGVKALHTTDRMGYSGAERRLGETCQFVVAVMVPGGLFENGGAIPVVAKVRLMHAASRFLILEGEWDSKADGLPINLEDLLGTLMSFAHTPIRSMTKLGKDIPREAREDYLHFWNVVGFLLGIPEEILPHDTLEAEEVVRAIYRRHFRSSPEGIELTRALFKCFTAMMPGPFLDGGVYALARYCVGDEISDMLEIPKSRWELVVKSGGLMGRISEGLQQRSGMVNGLVNKLGWVLLNQGGMLLSRGQKAGFKIPTEIRRAWRLPPINATPRIAALMPGLIASIREAAGSGSNVDEAIVGLGALVASADGEIDDFEVEVLAHAFQALGKTEGRPDAIDTAGVRARVEAAAAQIAKVGSDRYRERLSKQLVEHGALRPGLALACAIAYANSGIAAEERCLIEAIATDGGLGGDALAAIVDQTRTNIEAEG